MITVVLIVTVVSLCAAFLYRALSDHRRKYADIPPIGSRWPFVGNRYDASKTHLVFTDWSKQYGPVFRYQHYGKEIVVLNDFDTIYEALVTKGSDFAGRPRMDRTDYERRNEHSIVWQTYTPKLQFLRKQIHSSLRMYGDGLSRLQEQCGTEIHELICRIRKFDGAPFDSWSLLYDSACNIMLHLALGKRLPYDGEDLTQLKEVNGLFNHTFGPGSSRVLDGLPWLHYMEEYRILKKAIRLRDQFWKDHGSQSTGSGDHTEPVDSVISDLRRLSQDPRYNQYLKHDATLKETFTNLILAGTDTTTTALTCFILILIHHEDVQKLLHDEIDHVIGGSRDPLLGDRAHMPLMEACLLETLRLISHVPLAVPHSTICDTKVAGKHIPKDTTVYINLWAMHHDETFWEQPYSFKYSRFLDSEGHILPAHHSIRKRLMAFGAGRRVCLGETLAKNRLFLFGTALLQHFAFTRDPNSTLISYEPRDFTLGIVLHPGSFKVIARNRHECENI